MRRVLSAGGYSLASVVAQGLTRLIYSVLIARFLSPGSLADTNALISIALFAALLWPSSVASAATLFVARARGAADEATEQASLRFLTRRALLSNAALGLAAAVYAGVVFAPGDLITAVFAFCIVVGFGLSAFVRGVLFATDRIARAAILDVAALATAVAGLGIVIVAGADVVLLLPLVVSYAVIIVVGWPRSRGTGTSAPRREMDRFVLWGIAGAVATGGFLQLTMVIAHAVGSTAEGDLYAAALTLATPAAMLTSVVSLVLFPRLARAVGGGDHDRAQRQTDLAMRGLTVVLVATFGSLILLAPLLLDLIYGERFADASLMLAVLLIASLLGALAGPAADALGSRTTEGIRVLAMVRLAGFGVGLTLCLVLGATLGTLGVALGYLGGLVVASVGAIGYAWKRLDQHWGWLAARFLVGTIVLLGLARSQADGVDAWVSLALTAVFVLFWSALSVGDVRGLVRGLRASGGR